MPTVRAVLITCVSAVLNRGDSFRLPGAVTNRDDIAVAITEGYHLVTLHVLVSTESQIVAPFLGCSGRPIPMNNAGIQLSFFIKH